MDRNWLENELNAGRSMESIAREVGLDARTVGYYARKFGLRSQHAGKHASRGGIPREVLEPLVVAGKSSHEIARELSVSQTTVRHWLKRYELTTRKRPRYLDDDNARILRECRHHGLTDFVRYGPNDHHRCDQCRKDRVIKRRREVKRILVMEAGGRCQRCGYDRSLAALHFHHPDPSEKAFGLAMNGSARSLERAREEAAKCELLCANCHAEEEWGDATLSSQPQPPG